VPAVEAELVALAREGLEHAVQGRHFEAHESWEEAWRSRNGEEKLYLQALIQAAVALHHAAAGNSRGRLSMLEKSRVKMASLASSSFALPSWARVAGLPDPPLFLRRLHALDGDGMADESLFPAP